MTRDQAVAQILIWAAPIGTLLLIALALAWARAREIIAARPRDTGRTPSPAETADAIACGCEDGDCFWCAARTGADRLPSPTKRPYVRGIPQADRYPDDAACGPCACGPCALHADREADWQSWEREVTR